MLACDDKSIVNLSASKALIHQMGRTRSDKGWINCFSGQSLVKHLKRGRSCRQVKIITTLFLHYIYDQVPERIHDGGSVVQCFRCNQVLSPIVQVGLWAFTEETK